MANLSELTTEHRKIMNDFNELGYRATAWEANNPKYIEIYARCNIIQFEAALAKLDYHPIGIGLYTQHSEEWYTAWVLSHGC